MPEIVTLVWGIIASVGMFIAVGIALRDIARGPVEDDDAHDDNTHDDELHAYTFDNDGDVVTVYAHDAHDAFARVV